MVKIEIEDFKLEDVGSFILNETHILFFNNKGEHIGGYKIDSIDKVILK